MLFAHAPLGFLSAFTTKKLWKKFQLTKEEQYLMLAVGFVAGAIPDIDLVYYYLFNAEGTHRAFLTHVPLTYVILFIVGAAITLALKRHKWFVGVTVFSIAVMSHLVTDMFVAQIQLFYPFSTEFYGIADLGIEQISTNLFFLNMLLEGTIVFFFFYVIIWMVFKQRSRRTLVTAILILGYLGLISTVTWMNRTLYHSPYGSFFGDTDSDGIANYEDEDIDGDGYANLEDPDANGDGELTIKDLTDQAEYFIGGRYDITEGGLIEIPERLGFVANNGYIRQLYGGIGINLEMEMKKDYEQNPDGYIYDPAHTKFDRDNANIRVWLEHLDKVETGERLENGRHQIGDILYFSSGFTTVVTGFDNTGKPIGLDIHKDRPIMERFIEEIVADEGPVEARAKVLDGSLNLFSPGASEVDDAATPVEAASTEGQSPRR